MAMEPAGNLGGWATEDKESPHGPHCYKKSYATRCARCGADVRGWECDHGKKGFFDAGSDPAVEHVCATARRERERAAPAGRVTPMGDELRDGSCPDCGAKVKLRQRLGVTWHLDRETLRTHECRSAKA